MRPTLRTVLVTVLILLGCTVAAAHAGRAPQRETAVTIGYDMARSSFEGKVKSTRKCRGRRAVFLYAKADGGGDAGIRDRTFSKADGSYEFEPSMLEPDTRYWTRANRKRSGGVVCLPGTSRRLTFNR
ncbi:hypothetical protein HJD18_12320 [Thermoleophilia bacterium SCSIO 60948]|nr:hypothetical protein HJD18_12320 [Thermoleophilia bacterium SCSIO 60948]